jgi:hypothetical protein
LTKNKHHKEKRETNSAPSSKEDLPRTIKEYAIDMDKVLLRSIALDATNTIFHTYTKDQPKPKPYRKADRWDHPLAKAPGGRSFEVDVNKFLRLIKKEIGEDIT